MTKQAAKLEENSLGLSESIIMGVAGTAPAFSIAATTGTLIAAVGLLSVASLFYCGLIMFGVTLAFLHLNSIKAHAGAAYAWVGDVFHPLLGFFAGWSLLVASSVFMVSGTIPAATATLAIFSPAHMNNTYFVIPVAALWLILIGFVVIKGTQLAAIVQVILTIVELAALALIIAGGFWYFLQNPVAPVHWSEFSLKGFTPELFASGALIALFFFWGWDVTLNLSEETSNSKKNPGKGAVWAMIIVLAIFICCTIAVQLALTNEEIQKAGTNVLLALAEKVFPAPYSYMAVIAVMFSTIGTLETTMLQFSRTMFAKGRDGVLHPRYAVLHSEWKTPWISTLVILGIGLLLLFSSLIFPTVNSIIDISVKAIGFQVAFYYGLTGYACSWLFRKEGMTSLNNFITLTLWPFLSASFMVMITVYSIKAFDWTTIIIGLGGILCGFIPYLLNKFSRRRRS